MPLKPSSSPKDTWDVDYAAQTKTSKAGDKITVSKASMEEKIILEQMLHQSAMEGNGYGVDEFKEDGTWNRRLLS